MSRQKRTDENVNPLSLTFPRAANNPKRDTAVPAPAVQESGLKHIMRSSSHSGSNSSSTSSSSGGGGGGGGGGYANKSNNSNKVRSASPPKSDALTVPCKKKKTTKMTKTTKKSVKDGSSPKRAENSFMLYRKVKEKEIRDKFLRGEPVPGMEKPSTNQKDLSVVIGKMWKALSDEEKKPYKEEAQVKAQEFAALKAAEAANNSDGSDDAGRSCASKSTAAAKKVGTKRKRDGAAGDGGDGLMSMVGSATARVIKKPRMSQHPRVEYAYQLGQQLNHGIGSVGGVGGVAGIGGIGNIGNIGRIGGIGGVGHSINKNKNNVPLDSTINSTGGSLNSTISMTGAALASSTAPGLFSSPVSSMAGNSIAAMLSTFSPTGALTSGSIGGTQSSLLSTLTPQSQGQQATLPMTSTPGVIAGGSSLLDILGTNLWPPLQMPPLTGTSTAIPDVISSLGITAAPLPSLSTSLLPNPMLLGASQLISPPLSSGGLSAGPGNVLSGSGIGTSTPTSLPTNMPSSLHIRRGSTVGTIGHMTAAQWSVGSQTTSNIPVAAPSTPLGGETLASFDFSSIDIANLRSTLRPSDLQAVLAASIVPSLPTTQPMPSLLTTQPMPLLSTTQPVPPLSTTQIMPSLYPRLTR